MKEISNINEKIFSILGYEKDQYIDVVRDKVKPAIRMDLNEKFINVILIENVENYVEKIETDVEKIQKKFRF